MAAALKDNPALQGLLLRIVGGGGGGAPVGGGAAGPVGAGSNFGPTPTGSFDGAPTASGTAGAGGYTSPLAGWNPSWGGSGGAPPGSPSGAPTGGTPPGATPTTPTAPPAPSGQYQFKPNERGADVAAIVQQLLGTQQAQSPAGQQAAAQQGAARIAGNRTALGLNADGSRNANANRPALIRPTDPGFAWATQNAPVTPDGHPEAFDQWWTLREAGYQWDPRQGGWVAPQDPQRLPPGVSPTLAQSVGSARDQLAQATDPAERAALLQNAQAFGWMTPDGRWIA
jgi:hypothetical protein